MGFDRVDEAFLGALLPSHEIAAITHAEERHGDGEPGLVSPAGQVIAIRAVYCGYEAPLPISKTLVPVPDSAVIEPRANATGWEDEALYSKTFLGYLVDVGPVTTPDTYARGLVSLVIDLSSVWSGRGQFRALLRITR